MKAGEAFEVSGGWLLCGRELALRTELVQGLSVEPAAAVNVPEGTAGAHWHQLELKYSSRSAPVVVFVGTEKECRCKLGVLARKLRAAE